MLRSLRYGAADGILHVYTRDRGGVSAMAKGASIDDFRHPDGGQGSFQDRFLIPLREGEPCLVCGRPVRKLRAAGRGTYVCEGCQPRPRARPAANQATARNSASRPARSAAASS